MKRPLALVCLVLSALLVTAEQFPHRGKDKEPTTRLLTGQVTGPNGAPLPNAVVYLTNTRTMAIKTYIVGKDGNYRFPELSPNVDYRVYAQHNNLRSDTKTLSSFDSRTVTSPCASLPPDTAASL